MLLDCHTHKIPPCTDAIVSVSPDAELVPGQLYSVGLHPWHLSLPLGSAMEKLEGKCVLPQVVAVGECGLDSCCDTPAWVQVKAFEEQALLAERLGKPLIVHCVRRAQEVAQLRRSLKASVPWVIHGFRSKPTVLKMLLDAGCHISYGADFNPVSLNVTPLDRLLAETDESTLSITEIITALSEVRGLDLLPVIIENSSQLFL